MGPCPSSRWCRDTGRCCLAAANKDGVLGSITHYTVRLVWHEMLRSRADIVLIALGVVVFLVGSMVLARPFVRKKANLFVTVPATALVGIAALGAVALIVGMVVALLESPGDFNWSSMFNNLAWWTPGGRRNRRK